MTAQTAERKAALPPMTVARFEEAMRLVERLVDEHTDVFVGAMHRYRERAREGTSRGLTAVEAAQVAAGLAEHLGAEDPETLTVLAERVQGGSLRAVDEPAASEVLLAAGLHTAPAFVGAALDVTALIELPADVFEAAYDEGTVDAAVADAVKVLRREPLSVMRSRAEAALGHMGQEAGVPEGEGLRLLAATVWQALNQSMTTMAPNLGSGLSSLTGSLDPTGGPVQTSSTEPEPVTP